MPKNSHLFIAYNKADEDKAGFKKLITQLAAMAGEAAYSEAKALHLPKIFATTNEIIVQQADGTQTIIATAIGEHHGPFFQKFIPNHG